MTTNNNYKIPKITFRRDLKVVTTHILSVSLFIRERRQNIYQQLFSLLFITTEEKKDYRQHTNQKEDK